VSEAFKKFWWSRPVQWFCEPIVACWCLLLLFVLTFFGTVYQVGHGLFEAKRVFFDSYWFFAGVMPQSLLDLFDPNTQSAGMKGVIAVLRGLKWVLTYVPFPGTQLVLLLLAVNLFAYMINMLFMPKIKFGIVLIHAGLITMLVGGAVTHRYAEESQLTLGEGEAGNATAHYHQWELALVSEVDGLHDVRALDAAGLKAGDVLDFGVPGIRVKVEQYLGSSLVDGSATRDGAPASRMGIAGLREVPKHKEPERNIAGGVFEVKAGDDAKRFLLFGESDVSADPVSVGGKEYWLVLRHKRYPMPMTIQLTDFKRELHTGTGMAKSYSSKVLMLDGGLERTVSISMNDPLRHRGYTLYQSSFQEDQRTGAQFSTFAVVHNYGRTLPYISTGIIVFGMLLHFIVMLVKGSGRKGTR
jgi:hypothetical protein